MSTAETAAGDVVRSASAGEGLSVSVLITNHNYGQFLASCLESVRAQTRQPMEVIIVDDGSTDESRAFLAQLDGARVILQEQEGQAGALDSAVAAARGDVLCFLDADDAFVPEKLEQVCAFLEAHPEIDWIRHRLELADRDLSRLGATTPPIMRSGTIAPHRGVFAERVVTAATSGIAVRRTLADRVFPLSTARTSAGAFALARDADALMLGRIAAVGARGYTMTGVLALYRRHEQQMYPSGHDVRRLLQRQIDVADAVARELGAPWGEQMQPSPCHKHAMILATLSGASRWSRARVQAWMRGARAVAVALWDRPVAGARQLAALTFAFLTPGIWLRKFHRGQAWSA